MKYVVNKIEYTVIEEQNRIEREFDGHKLVVQYMPALIGESGFNIFVLADGVCIPMGLNRNYRKDSSRQEYIDNQRPPILNYVSWGQIMRATSDFKEIFGLVF